MLKIICPKIPSPEFCVKNKVEILYVNSKSGKLSQGISYGFSLV